MAELPARQLKYQRPGRKVGSGRRLGDAQEAAIRDNTPDQLKLPYALWTRESVQQVIVQQHDVKPPTRTLGHYLKRWEMTPQKSRRSVPMGSGSRKYNRLHDVPGR